VRDCSFLMLALPMDQVILLGAENLIL